VVVVGVDGTAFGALVDVTAAEGFGAEGSGELKGKVAGETLGALEHFAGVEVGCGAVVWVRGGTGDGTSGAGDAFVGVGGVGFAAARVVEGEAGGALVLAVNAAGVLVLAEERSAAISSVNSTRTPAKAEETEELTLALTGGRQAPLRERSSCWRTELGRGTVADGRGFDASGGMTVVTAPETYENCEEDEAGAALSRT
jgi:hypothetical protein